MVNNPDSNVHGANMGPIWGQQDPGGPHVGPMNFAIWEIKWLNTETFVLQSHEIVPFHKDFSPSGEQFELHKLAYIVITIHCRLYSNILQIMLLYKTWRCYSKFHSTKSLGVRYRCVKLSLCDDWENIYTLSYYHHQIGSMNYYPLFRVRSWNNGMRCMSFYILTMRVNRMVWQWAETLVEVRVTLADIRGTTK